MVVKCNPGIETICLQRKKCAFWNVFLGKANFLNFWIVSHVFKFHYCLVVSYQTCDGCLQTNPHLPCKQQMTTAICFWPTQGDLWWSTLFATSTNHTATGWWLYSHQLGLCNWVPPVFPTLKLLHYYNEESKGTIVFVCLHQQLDMTSFSNTCAWGLSPPGERFGMGEVPMAAPTACWE